MTKLLHYSQMILSLFIVSQRKTKTWCSLIVLIRTLPPCDLTHNFFFFLWWSLASRTVPECRAVPGHWMILERGTTKCEVGHPDHKGLWKMSWGLFVSSGRLAFCHWDSLWLLRRWGGMGGWGGQLAEGSVLIGQLCSWNSTCPLYWYFVTWHWF